GRARVARVLHARLRELRESDSDVALRHVYAHKGRLFARGDPSFEAVSRRLYALVSSRLPADQAVRMLLRPLLLPAWLERRLDPPIARLATWIMAP
ncbi:MAG: ferritin-like domain-containing protein, partial [Ottowia sp.]|nr:ferritin-like domain-containing protein [Ottowia sp.]